MLNLIRLEKPNLGKFNPSSLLDWLGNNSVLHELNSTISPSYIYFDGLKRWPKAMGKEEFWALVKLQRRFASKPIPPINYNDRPFTLEISAAHNEKQFLLLNRALLETDVIDEIVYSAAIESDEVSIMAARKFLLEAAYPKTEAEKLVKRTQKIYNDVLEQDKLALQPERFRNEDERFVPAPHNKEFICYIAPRSDVFEREWKRFLAFANDELPHDFIHPVTKAAIIHFWALLLKPLPQHSGVFARAASYWYLKKQRIALPISRFIKTDLTGYSNAITYAVQDDNNFTYFLDFFLRKLDMAIDGFEKSQKNKKDFRTQLLPAIQRKHNLNERQAALVYELSKMRNNRTNFSAYMRENNITRKTAADDLKRLEREGYLKSQKLGKNIFYYAGDKAMALLQ